MLLKSNISTLGRGIGEFGYPISLKSIVAFWIAYKHKMAIGLARCFINILCFNSPVHDTSSTPIVGLSDVCDTLHLCLPHREFHYLQPFYPQGSGRYPSDPYGQRYIPLLLHRLPCLYILANKNHLCSRCFIYTTRHNIRISTHLCRHELFLLHSGRISI